MQTHNQAYAMQPPAVQAMTPNSDLSRMPGVAIRQVAQWGEAILQAVGIPWESKNKYKIVMLPPGQHPRRNFQQADGYWKVTGEELVQMPTIMQANEESDACERICLTAGGCGNLRALKLHFMDPLAPQMGDMMTAERDCKMGAICCCPLETRLNAPNQQRIGRVVEDFDCGKCLENACCCLFYAKVLDETGGAPVHKYTLRTGLCCAGGHNNCCTLCCCECCCFKHDLLIDVLDANGKVVTTVQNAYAPMESCCTSWCRVGQKFTNYVLEFPPNATEAERRLLLTALFHVDYQLFEKKGNENDSNN